MLTYILFMNVQRPQIEVSCIECVPRLCCRFLQVDFADQLTVACPSEELVTVVNGKLVSLAALVLSICDCVVA